MRLSGKAVGITLFLAVAVGCGQETSNNSISARSGSSESQESTVDNSLTNPADVLALAGLTMPTESSGSVTGVDNEATTVDRSLYAYIVTLSAPRESFEAWTDSDGASVYTELAPWDEALSDDSYGIQAEMGFSGPPPENSRRNLYQQFDTGVKGYSGHYAIYLLGPDQTTAYVLVFTAGSPTTEDWDMRR